MGCFDKTKYLGGDSVAASAHTGTTYVGPAIPMGPCCEAAVSFDLTDVNLAAGETLDFACQVETANDPAGPWEVVAGEDPVSCEKEDAFFTEGELTGTFADGTGYNVFGAGNSSHASGDEVRALANNNFEMLDAAPYRENLITWEFDSPVCIVVSASAANEGGVWHVNRTELTTDGTPWVFTPGPSDPGIVVTGGSAVNGAANAGSVTSSLDWGTLESDNVTTFTWNSYAFDGLTLDVKTLPQNCDAQAVAFNKGTAAASGAACFDKPFPPGCVGKYIRVSFLSPAAAAGGDIRYKIKCLGGVEGDGNQCPGGLIDA